MIMKKEVVFSIFLLIILIIVFISARFEPTITSASVTGDLASDEAAAEEINNTDHEYEENSIDKQDSS